MSQILIWSGVFLGSLALLVKASDWFIESAEKISLALKIPPFIIGISVVALGTSLPELVSSIIAVINNSSEIVAANVVGSNISNILFVLGIVALMHKRLKLNFRLSFIDIGMIGGSALLLWWALWDRHFSNIETAVFLFGLLSYLYYTIKRGKSEQKRLKKEAEQEAEQLVKDRSHYYELDEANDLLEAKQQPTDTDNHSGKVKGWVIVMLLISSGLIYLSASYNIKSIIKLSELLHIGAEIIALTAVSLGTSLPELFVSISAVRKKNGEMAVGNVLGSNIFNIFGVMGIPALFGKLYIPPIVINFSIPLMLVATALYIFLVIDKDLKRWEGVVLLSFYVLFLGKLVLGT